MVVLNFVASTLTSNLRNMFRMGGSTIKSIEVVVSEILWADFDPNFLWRDELILLVT